MNGMSRHKEYQKTFLQFRQFSTVAILYPDLNLVHKKFFLAIIAVTWKSTSSQFLLLIYWGVPPLWEHQTQHCNQHYDRDDHHNKQHYSHYYASDISSAQTRDVTDFGGGSSSIARSFSVWADILASWLYVFGNVDIVCACNVDKMVVSTSYRLRWGVVEATIETVTWCVASDIIQPRNGSGWWR